MQEEAYRTAAEILHKILLRPGLLSVWENSCLYPVFSCFGARRELDACEAHDGIGVVEAQYDDDRYLTFYTHDGRQGRRTGFGETPCFDASPSGQGGLRVGGILGGI